MTIPDKLFDKAIIHVLKLEGGFNNNINDNGGITKFGISQKSYPDLNILKLTIEQATEIYRKDYWAPYPYDKIIDEKIAIKLFDLAVNMGAKPAHKILQKSLNFLGFNVVIDGQFGNITLNASNQADAKLLLEAIKLAAAVKYHQIVAVNDSQKVFLKGWLNRAYA